MIASRIAEYMRYKHIVMFPHARHALRQWRKIGKPLVVPSNCCGVLGQLATEIKPIDLSGLAPGVPVQLYGYREPGEAEIEVDPLMTGWFESPQCPSSVISFGYGKMLDAGGGGAFLTNDLSLAEEVSKGAEWPSGLTQSLNDAFMAFPETIKRRRQRMEWWDRHLGDTLIRIPREQIMPWRCIRRTLNQADQRLVVRSLRAAGTDVGTNYPRLPTIDGMFAEIWEKTVLNFFVTDDYDEARIKGACEIIKRAIGG